VTVASSVHKFDPVFCIVCLDSKTVLISVLIKFAPKSYK
jgi:hypothetical protein